MKIETLEKAKKLQEEIKATKDSLRYLTNIKDRMSVTRKRYGNFDTYYDYVCEVDNELKEIIKERLVAKKERLEKELEEL